MGPMKLMAAGVFALGLFLTGCNSSGGGAAVAEGDLVGKWVMNKSVTIGSFKVTTNGETKTTPMSDTSVYTDATYYVDLKTDKTYTANYPSTGGLGKVAPAAAPLENGTWSVSGNVLTTISADKDTSALSTTISGNAGTFVTVMDNKYNSGTTIYETHLDITMTATKQ